MGEPLSPGSWDRQLREMMDRRIRIFERIMPYKVASDVHRHQSEFLEQQMTMFARAQRGMLLAIVPDPLRRDAEFVEALDLLMSFDTWRGCAATRS